ncbi:hypothetical protein QN277_016588 [Acacia crassicarpa]|uniref:TIR domain-containing protein n=1 Tax=Acacia crassicarpa TaxID=499986 RepID=A0AAE1MX46_9FABA|nr:hypothetical protein QN277_016588 [Acacia crassicarpa]
MDLLEFFSFLLIISFLLCRLLFLISCRLLLSTFSWAVDKIKYLPVTLGISANNVGEESSSSFKTLNSSPEWKYDVFLSFAGKDTGLNFTNHLYKAFSRSGIRCFRDDVDLQKGKDINSPFRAIEDSLCVVLVISKNYAKSTWCLDELQKILEPQNTSVRRVFPIFYNVNPADVRDQRESFGKALAEFEKKFKEDKTRVKMWRAALSQIGNLSGWVTRDKHGADIIKNIVGEVWSFLSPKLPSLEDNLVGIDSKVADVISFLEIWLDDKRFVGIWGMGGMGKTTLARVVYKKLKRSGIFENCHFLGGTGIKNMTICPCNEKVLVVVDDIDDMSQLNNLVGSPIWFGKGSRIIITTRDRNVLSSLGEERIYELKTMKNDESLQIFLEKAFNKNHPEEKYLEYSKFVVKYAGGLPLALQALGSYFCGKSEEAVWRNALEKLKQINPHKDILDVLKISYDGLDEQEQSIFLDIVCLFKRWDKEEVTQILNACDLNPILGINVLIEKNLLVENEHGELDMHDLYEELGWHISPNSRLGKFAEIKEVLENNKGSGEIQSIVMGNKDPIYEKIVVHPEAFSKMSKIRLLILNCETKIHPVAFSISGALKFVRWPYFPKEALPLLWDEPIELVHIEMPNSKMKQLWNGIKSMNHLKFIDLSGSHDLTETPDFSNVQCLGHLCLSGCISLVTVHESLGVLKELVEVDLHDCRNLNNLPSKLETNSLRMLDLGGCNNVKKLPEFGEGMKKLLYLDASYTAITSLPESLGSLTGLRFLNLSGTGFRNLPTGCFSGLVGLVFLSLEGCKWLVSLPRLPSQLTRLEVGCCCSMERSLDEQLLDWVTSLDHECRGQTKYVISDEGEEYLPLTGMADVLLFHKREDFEVESEYHPLRNFFAIMPLRDRIPSWFDPNIKYYDEGYITECEIKVDVPPNFRASKWSGIVACLHIKGPDYSGVISWSSKALEDDEYKGCAELPYGIRRLSEDGLCVMVLEFNEGTCWQYLRGDSNSLHIQLSSRYKERFSCGSMGILGYGWRVICKEDIQKWSNPNQFNQFTQLHHVPPSEVKLPWRLLRKLLGLERRSTAFTKVEASDHNEA